MPAAEFEIVVKAEGEMTDKAAIVPGAGLKKELPHLAYKINDAARMIGISRSKMYGLARKGKVVILKLDGRSVVPDESLRGYIASLTPLHR